MKLYLVQHGKAMTEDENAKRPLTVEGRAEVTKVGQFLKNSLLEVDRIWHSTKTRAAETAEIFAGQMQVKELCEQLEGMSPNDPVDSLARKVQALTPEDEIENLMIVGHLPFLEKLSSSLLRGPSAGPLIQFHQGGVVCLEQKNKGPWQFVWAVIPDILK